MIIENSINNNNNPNYKNKNWLTYQYITLKKSTSEIAKTINISQTTINRWLKKFNIPRRTKSEALKIIFNKPEIKEKMMKIKRKKKGVFIGEKSGCWKGNKAGYSALHSYVRKYKPKVVKCEICGNVRKLYASHINHNYSRDLDEYRWLCCPCHKKYDINLKNAKQNQKLKINLEV